MQLDGEVVKTYRKIKGTNVQASITKLGIDNQLKEVGLVLSAKVRDQTISKVRNILTSAGVSDAFIKEFTQNKEVVSKIAAFFLHRIDTTTGVQESFGLLPPGQFNDTANARAQHGVTEPLGGRGYKYVAKLCIRSPIDLFKEAAADLKVQNPKVDTTKFVKKLAQKFNDVPELGLPSVSAINADLDYEQEFIRGMTGHEYSTSVYFKLQPPSIALGVTRDNRGRNVVTFHVDGTRELIDHVLVFAEYGGIKAPIAAIHVGEKSTYTVYDCELSQEVGIVTYTVAIVGMDYKIMSESQSKSITNVSNLANIQAVDSDIEVGGLGGNLQQALAGL